MEEEDEEDRISQLPDSILHVIISSIDVKEAVQTSLLSTRWRFLWSSMPELSFDFHRHTRHNSADYRFLHFVDQFLAHRDPTSAVTKFYLRGRFGRVRDRTFFARYVDYAVTHGVRDLDINALHTHSSIPDSFFACKSLKQLTLRCFTLGFNIPRESSLPNLTALHVENSSLSKEPFAGFPNLVKLSLHSCDIESLVIVSPKLKILEITFDDNYRFPTYPSMQRVSAPVLMSLKYQGYFPLECAEVELPILEEVCLETSEKIGRRFNGRHEPSKCARMLQLFGIARVVTLALSTLEVLEADLGLLERSPRPFPHMKRLKLTKGRQPDVSHPLRRVMDYLTACDASLVVEFPEDVRVVESRVEEVDEDISTATRMATGMIDANVLISKNILQA